MIKLVELPCESAIRVPFGTLGRRSGGWVYLATTSSTSTLADAELADSDGLLVAVRPDGLLALGEESHTLIGWDATAVSLRVLDSVARLDLPGYDPGGLNRVIMHPVDEDRVLLETEVGVSLVDFGRGVVWAEIHDDLTARVDRVADGVVHVVTESALAELSLADGSYLGGKPHD